MKNMLQKLMVAGLVAVTGIGSLAVPAYADSIVLSLDRGGVSDVQYRDEREWDRDRPRHESRRHDRRGRCDPWLAVEKARYQGLRRARVSDVSSRRVVVDGRRDGARRYIAFANVRGCPTIGRW